MNQISYAEALHKAMYSGLEKNDDAFIIGQGVRDHKSIFGTTTGLVEKFGSHRVVESPIAEDLMTGVGLGASLNGLYPIMTHIRMDFSLLAMNQIVNLYAKYKYMFGGQFAPKGLIRLVVGRSWGQGAQHAQSLQSFFGHIPGLTVIMPSNSESVLRNYNFAIQNYDSLVIAIEHRNLYEIIFETPKEIDYSNTTTVSWKPRIAKKGSDVTIVATSIMVLEAIRAAEHLEKYFKVSVEVIDLESVSNIDISLIVESLSKTKRLLIADTSWLPYGVASEITRLVCERDPGLLKNGFKAIGMEFTPCPTGKNLEDMFYPSIRTIVTAILEMCKLPIIESSLPSGESYRDFYRKFRGPF